MKRKHWIIYAMVLALLMAGVTAVRLLPHKGPEVSSLYQRYEHQPGVRVGFVKALPLDDSTSVDVTTIEALDSAGWQWLQEEFAIGLWSQTDSVEGNRSFSFRRMDKEVPSLMPPADSGDFDMLVVSLADSCVSIYHLENERQHDRIVELAFEKYLSINE